MLFIMIGLATFAFLLLLCCAAWETHSPSPKEKAGQKPGFQDIFEHAAIGMAQITPEGRWLKVNRKLRDITGYSNDDLKELTVSDITHPDDLKRHREKVKRLLSGEVDHYITEERVIRKDGKTVWARLTVSMVNATGDHPRYVIIMVEDISPRKAREDELRLAKRVIDNVQEGVFVTDVEGIILSVNSAFCKITGYDRTEITGQNVKMLTSVLEIPDFYAGLLDSLGRDGQWMGEIWDTRKSGEVYPKWLSASAIRDDDDNITHFVGIFSDLSAAKQAEQALYHLSNFDNLTGIANRSMFMERLRHSITAANKSRSVVAIVHLDLDNFKLINETMGYPQGDQILKAAARRLGHCIKERDTIARLGSDEFGIILTEMRDSKNAAKVAMRLMEVLSRPFELEGKEVFTSCSMGISIYPDDGTSGDDLVKNATMALRHAKEHPGKRNYRYFSQEMNDKVSERLKMELALHGALERGEFRLFYQPKVDVASGAITSMEALLRWEHPDLGMVPPFKFIPLAEDNGLIIPIGQWVLDTACRQTSKWRNNGFPPLRVSVNLSARQFMQANLVDQIVGVLGASGLAPELLELEITESLLMDDAEKTIEVLRRLKHLGVFISIDDFGTGYSSLNYLRRFPVDAIKIDRSFIFEVITNPDDAAITTAIIGLAESLDLRVTAEGVETRDHVRFLKQRRCQEFQGFYFSKPLCVADFEALLHQRLDFLDMLE